MLLRRADCHTSSLNLAIPPKNLLTPHRPSRSLSFPLRLARCHIRSLPMATLVSNSSRNRHFLPLAGINRKHIRIHRFRLIQDLTTSDDSTADHRIMVSRQIMVGKRSHREVFRERTREGIREGIREVTRGSFRLAQVRPRHNMVGLPHHQGTTIRLLGEDREMLSKFCGRHPLIM